MDDTQFLEELCQRHYAGEALKYVFFWGHQPGKAGITSSCFSQWYEAPFVIEGQRYATAEHFMMAEKAALFGDRSARSRVLEAATPGAAKAFGRGVSGFDEAVWTKHRFSIVVQANRAKFTQNPELGVFLKQTGSRILVEASPVDSIWGIGLAQDDVRANNLRQWRGLNLLGFALMEIRNSV